MRNLRSSALALAVVVTGPLAIAAAQDAEPVVQPEVAVQTPQDLGSDAQLAQAEAIEKQGAALVTRLQSMLDAARKSGDIIKVTCLNDKLTQINANVGNVSQRKTALSRAVALGDQEAAEHEYTVLTVLNQKFTALEQEAGQCIGQDMYESGAAQVVTDVPDDAPTDVDPTDPPPVREEPPYVTIPPPSSPSI